MADPFIAGLSYCSQYPGTIGIVGARLTDVIMVQFLLASTSSSSLTHTVQSYKKQGKALAANMQIFCTVTTCMNVATSVQESNRSALEINANSGHCSGH